MKSVAAGLLVSLALLVAACSEEPPINPAPSAVGAPTDASPAAPVSAAAATPSTAVIEFGSMTAGSSFGPEPPHDQSGHAKDKLVPRTVTISRNGTVKFLTFGVHQIRIYSPGIDPGDIDTSIVEAAPAGCPPQIPLIADPNGLLESIVKPCSPTLVELQYTFENAGKHLVICSFLPHFTQFQMYGWVTVR